MLRTATVFLLILISTQIVAAQTIHCVNDDATPGGDGLSWATAYDTLPPALTAAQPGDQIWVAAGAYVGNFTLALGVEMYGGFTGTETLLEQRDWATNETILDGNQTGSVVTGPTGATQTTRIDGFTITNGFGTVSGDSTDGGGVYLQASSPTIANNTITGNSADSFGGGGGLYVDSSSPTIANNTIANNGGGVGGGLLLVYSSPTIANNVIADNTAYVGGGLYLYYSSPTITNNTIAGNTGEGLRLNASSPVITNTIIAFNWSGIRQIEGGTPMLRHNCVYGNTSYNYSGITDPTGTAGNISINPRLADRHYGNTHIQPDSPCVDAGDSAVACGNFDIDGDPRILPLDGAVDIGADESDGTVWPGPDAIVRVSPDGNDSNDGSYWEFAKQTIQAGINAAAAIGGDVWVQEGTYVGNVTLASGVGVYGGFVGTETELAQRDWVANETILDGNRSGSVVTGPAGATGTTRIDGFTITNGRGPWVGVNAFGGGLYMVNSSPTIANNTITGNGASRWGIGYGGGLYLSGSSATVTNNTISDNNAGRYGGGLCLSGLSATVANNTITGNTTEDEISRGGGLYITGGTPSATITDNMIADNSADKGGGLYVSYSPPTITDNIITANGARLGGGLYLDHHSATVTNNAIAGNRSSGSGGGIYLEETSPTIASNTITGNAASGNGGGLSMYQSPATIANNTFTANGSGSQGGGLYAFDSAPMIANNAFTDNSAADKGGGLCLSYGSSTVTNNTIVKNGARLGGGLFFYLSSPTIANTLVAFNSSGIAGGSTATLRNNCVFGNTTYDYSGLADATGTDGNISEDPYLADPQHGVVHIQPDSPCMDAGSSADASGDFDIDGDPRTLPVGGTVDIGADESDGTVWPEATYSIVRVSPEGDDTNDGSSWALAKQTVQAGIIAASALGGEVWVRAGTYEERITLHAYAHVYGGFSGTESVRDERDWVANATTLDGLQQGSVVTAHPGYRLSTIDGFTITGGSAASGGGLALYNCAPTIANSRITGNSANRGGGMYLGGASPNTINSRIEGNDAGEGGGLYLRDSSPIISNSTITGHNTDRGGGLYLHGSSPIISNSTIANNDSGEGGGLYLLDSSPIISNSTIADNDSGEGGGLYLLDSSPIISNSTIAGNGPDAFVMFNSSPTIENNTITGNGAGMTMYDSSPTITNTIVAFNLNYGVAASGGASTLRYNCVHGNGGYDYTGVPDPTGAEGNVATDPLFARNPDPGPDGEWGTEDDDYGDLHLSLDSPVIDAGDSAEVPADELDLDGDGDTAEPVPFDLDGYARFVDDPLTPDTGSGTAPIVDMGAYEFGPDDCRHGGGLDHDGDVDLVNFAAFERCVMGPDSVPAPGCECFDLNATGRVDLADVAIFQASFTDQ